MIALVDKLVMVMLATTVFPAATIGGVGGAERNKTGTNEGRIAWSDSQMEPPAVVAAGGQLKTESPLRRSNREALLSAIREFFRDNPTSE